MSRISGAALIDRRSALVAIAAAAMLPRELRASYVPRKSEVRSKLAQHFADEGTDGTFVAFDPQQRLTIASDDVRAQRMMLPASTFKIPNSLIALETGVVADPDKDVFKWDGKTYPIEAWNKDHTLRTAIAVSAVPVYQEIARRIGAERMQKYVDAFDYGNRNIGGGIDRFWLTGDLRISAAQQVAFVEKVRSRALPLSTRTMTFVHSIMPVTKAGEATIRAKTGLVGIDDRRVNEPGQVSVGWLVGWAEKGERQTSFALNLDVREPRHSASRMVIAQKCLAAIEAI